MREQVKDLEGKTYLLSGRLDEMRESRMGWGYCLHMPRWLHPDSLQDNSCVRTLARWGRRYLEGYGGVQVLGRWNKLDFYRFLKFLWPGWLWKRLSKASVQSGFGLHSRSSVFQSLEWILSLEGALMVALQDSITKGDILKVYY